MMKASKNFALRQIAGTWVLLPLGQMASDMNGMVTLNETGVLLWRCLENGATREELAKALTDEYEVSTEEALADVDEYVKKLEKSKCIEQ